MYRNDDDETGQTYYITVLADVGLDAVFEFEHPVQEFFGHFPFFLFIYLT